jgi:hypothetical protein
MEDWSAPGRDAVGMLANQEFIVGAVDGVVDDFAVQPGLRTCLA